MKKLVFGLIMAGSMMLTGFSFVEKTISVPENATDTDGNQYRVKLTYIQFEGKRLPSTLVEFNHLLRTEADEACNKFLSLYGAENSAEVVAPGEDPDQLTGTYFLSLQSESLISLKITHEFQLPSTDEEFYNETYYNFQVATGRNLQFEDCFTLKTSPEEWMDFVESEGGNIDRQYSLPESFLVNEYGVTFKFSRVEGEIDFMWADLEPYFEVNHLR